MRLESSNLNNTKLPIKNKIGTWNIIQCTCYLISLIICFICNLAINKGLTWFFIVLTAEMTAASLTLVPFLFKEKRLLGVTISFLISIGLLLLSCADYVNGDWFYISYFAIIMGFIILVMPLLLFKVKIPSLLGEHKTVLFLFLDTLMLVMFLHAANIYTHGNWFWTIAVPFTAFYTAFVWCIILFLRYAKCNGYFKCAFVLFICTILTYLSNPFNTYVLDHEPIELNIHFRLSTWNEEFIESNIIFLTVCFFCIFIIIFVRQGIKYIHKNM
jgi:hypothetical protein